MEKIKIITLILLIIMNFGCSKNPILEKSIKKTMDGKKGSAVFLNIDSDEIISPDPARAGERLAPCSTFKIWNTLIGIDTGKIKSADELFWKWDGEKRPVKKWNKDQTLKDAFQVSCVPAYQELAIKIGSKDMQKWINKISFGNRDISSGLDTFWLTRNGEKAIKISPEEQALLIKKLVTGKLPFSVKAQNILEEIMLVKTTSKGSVYGKTGTGIITDNKTAYNIGWYTGYVISKKRRYSFACLLKGKNIMGTDAKAIVLEILADSGLI